MRPPALWPVSSAVLAALFAMWALSARAVTVGAVGDSLTDDYHLYLAQYLTPMPQLSPTNPQPSGPDPMNWVEQLATDRSTEVDFGAFGQQSAPRYLGYANDWARAGATTTTMLSEGQHTGIAAQGLDLVYVGIGTNNFAPADLPSAGLIDVFGGIYNGCQSLTSCSTPFRGSNGSYYTSVQVYVSDLVTDVSTAVGVIGASGANIVLGTIGDFGDAPSSLVSFPVLNPGAYSDTLRRQLVSDAVDLANAGILQLALTNGIPVVDVHALLAAGDGSFPLALGGIAIQPGAPGGTRNASFFALPDGTHPDTLVQGILANAFVAAANAGYGSALTPLRDDEILANAGLSPASGWNGISFDASVFVLAPEPSTSLLLMTGLFALAARQRREAIAPARGIEGAAGANRR